MKPQTDEGASIYSLPKSYKSQKYNPEWNIPKWTYIRCVVGHFSHWAIRNIDSDEPYPPGLEKMVEYLYHSIRNKFDKIGYRYLTLCEINKMLHDVLDEENIFKSWDDENVLKGRLDLCALLNMVCISIRNERREADEFDRKFNERHFDETDKR